MAKNGLFSNLLRFQDPESRKKKNRRAQHISGEGTPEQREKKLGIRRRSFLNVNSYPVISKIISAAVVIGGIALIVFLIHFALEASLGEQYWELFL